MRQYLKSFSISVPLVTSILISFFTIDYSDTQSFYAIPLFILFVAGVVLLIDYKYFNQSIIAPVPMSLGSRDFFILKIYVGVVCLFCLLDWYFHGVVIFSSQEGLYMQFTPLEKRIRHISMLVWTFAPISFLVPNRKFKIVLALFAVLVLVSFLDRGRLMLMFAASILTLFIVKDGSYLNLKRISIRSLGLVVMATLMFSILGKYRSGAADVQLIEGSYLKTTTRPIGTECKLPDAIPYTDLYDKADIRVKWVLAYISLPVYNLSTQNVCQHQDSGALWRQIIPSWIVEFENKLYVLVSHKQNVATEFLPFYLSWQYAGVVLAIALVFICLHWSIRYYLRRRTIFSFLILIKLLATSVFLNFAPQFFVWTNFGFIILFYCIDQFSTSSWSDKIYDLASRRFKI
jgi:hypothetical protein